MTAKRATPGTSAPTAQAHSSVGGSFGAARAASSQSASTTLTRPALHRRPIFAQLEDVPHCDLVVHEAVLVPVVLPHCAPKPERPLDKPTADKPVKVAAVRHPVAHALSFHTPAWKGIRV